MLNTVVDLSRTWPNSLLRTGIGALAFSPLLLAGTPQNTPVYLANPASTTFVEALGAIFLLGLCLAAGTVCTTAGEAIALRLRPRPHANIIDLAVRVDRHSSANLTELFVTARFNLQALSGLVFAGAVSLLLAGSFASMSYAEVPVRAQRLSEATAMSLIFLLIGLFGTFGPISRLVAIERLVCECNNLNKEAELQKSG